MKILKILLVVLITTYSTVTAQQKIKLKGLIINPETLEQKEYPKVSVGIKGIKSTTSPNKKGMFKLKGKGTTLTIESQKYASLEKQIPTSARKVLILVNEYKGLIKFLDKKEKFEDIYDNSKEEFEKLKIIVDEAPIFPGCESVMKSNQKRCSENKFRKHLVRNFNTNLANELGLRGKIRILIYFEINKQGDPINIDAKAPHPALKREAIRIIKKLPKIIPGKAKGKPVKVKYALPLTFIAQ